MSRFITCRLQKIKIRTINMRLVQNAKLQILLGKQIQQRLFQFQIRSNGEIKFAKVPVKNDQLRPCIALQKICPFTCCEEYAVFLQKKLPEKNNYQKADRVVCRGGLFSVAAQSPKNQIPKQCIELTCAIRRYGERHRIKEDRIETSRKGRRIGHCAFAASIFRVQRLRQY